MKTGFPMSFTQCLFVGLSFIFFINLGEVLSADVQPSAARAAEAKGAMSAEELNRQVNNPVSSVWSMMSQNNYTQLKNDFGDVPGWDEGDDKRNGSSGHFRSIGGSLREAMTANHQSDQHPVFHLEIFPRSVAGRHSAEHPDRLEGR